MGCGRALGSLTERYERQEWGLGAKVGTWRWDDDAAEFSAGADGAMEAGMGAAIGSWRDFAARDSVAPAGAEDGIEDGEVTDAGGGATDGMGASETVGD